MFSAEENAKASLRLSPKTGTLMPSNNNSLIITAPTTNLRDQILNDPGWSVALGLCVFGFNNNHYLYENEKTAGSESGILPAIKNGSTISCRKIGLLRRKKQPIALFYFFDIMQLK